MNFQYLENIPGWYISNDNVYFRSSESLISQISQILEYAINDDYEKFSISEKKAVGFSIFLKKLRENTAPKYIKGQVVGPITFLTSHKLEDGTRLIKDDTYSDIIPLLLRQKALFQYYEFRKRCPNSDVIIFFDEPILSEIGSAVTNIELETAEKLIKKTIENVPFISGMHICGNSDWDFILKLPINIINFDAYSYLNEFLLYKKTIKEFINRGNSIALGIIPTDKEELRKADEKTILSKTLDAVDSLKDITSNDNIRNKIIITPSCGMGSLDIEESDKVFYLLNFLVQELNKRNL